MRIGINDLSFFYSFENFHDALEALHRYATICFQTLLQLIFRISLFFLMETLLPFVPTLLKMVVLSPASYHTITLSLQF